jgi:DnaJ-class molecular chaperone
MINPEPETRNPKFYAVSGFDLKMTYPIPLYNALTGVVIPLEMPDGRTVHVSVEELIDCGMIKTLKVPVSVPVPV